MNGGKNTWIPVYKNKIYEEVSGYYANATKDHLPSPSENWELHPFGFYKFNVDGGFNNVDKLCDP